MRYNEVKPGKNGYKIVFATNTVIMNYKFAAAAAQYGTKENGIIRDIRRDFPDMTETVVSGREKRTPQANTRLTYPFWLPLKSPRHVLPLWQVPTSM